MLKVNYIYRQITNPPLQKLTYPLRKYPLKRRETLASSGFLNIQSIYLIPAFETVTIHKIYKITAFFIPSIETTKRLEINNLDITVSLLMVIIVSTPKVGWWFGEL
jgi:hypothetical protein